jgi:hypothetical protein
MKTAEFSAEDLATLNRLYATYTSGRRQVRRQRLALAYAKLREALAALWGAIVV